jgi:hypothetical protein
LATIVPPLSCALQDFYAKLVDTTPFIRVASASPLVFTWEQRLALERHCVETLEEQYNPAAFQISLARVRMQPRESAGPKPPVL